MAITISEDGARHACLTIAINVSSVIVIVSMTCNGLLLHIILNIMNTKRLFSKQLFVYELLR